MLKKRTETKKIKIVVLESVKKRVRSVVKAKKIIKKLLKILFDEYSIVENTNKKGQRIEIANEFGFSKTPVRFREENNISFNELNKTNKYDIINNEKILLTNLMDDKSSLL